MSKKILYISYDGMTDPLGQSQVLPYLVSLSAQGYQFTILSFEKKARFQKEKAVITELCERSGITWIPLIYTRTPPVLSKIYDRRRMKQTALRLFREQQFAMIHCRSYVAAETGLWLKRKFGTKFLFDMRGFWADEKVDNGQWNQQNPFFRFVYHHYKRKEKSFLKEADGIISLTGAARSALLSWQGNQSLQIDVIPCCADLVHFNFQQIDSVNPETLRQQLDISCLLYTSRCV